MSEQTWGDARPIRIVLADDHALVIEGLRTLIDRQPDMEVVATVYDGDELLAFLAEHPDVDIAVLDVQMPYSGLRALSELRRHDHPVRILILTAFADGESIQSALQLGAEGFALKTESPTQTIDAIRQVAQGRLVFPRAAQRWMSTFGRGTEHTPQLSDREQEVLQHLSRGLPNAEIGTALSVSENTVRFHLKNIYDKLNVSNRTEAVAWYFQHSGKSV
ncbi:MAG: response regulator transcription factor [Caldilineaceae bacterium]|nr:response regulator transcription factor [Caldilineaceae bacterium]